MLKMGLILGLSAVVTSAWFVPTFNIGKGNDTTNVDKNFVRDAQKEIVINEKMSKMYSDVKPSPKMHFYAAWEYCQNMDLAGYKDWRVITKDEARDILELSRTKVTVKHAFRNVNEETYWTSTQDRFKQAWYVDFDLGRYSTKEKTYKYRTLCIRDSK